MRRAKAAPLCQWAQETFAGTQLGDRRLTQRLVAMAGAVAARPGGTVTSTMGTSATAEGAFRFVENTRVDPRAVTAGMCESTALACSGLGRVFVATDQTDLTFRDRKGIRGLGPDGANATATLRSTQVMNALALDEHGVPVGLVDQQWWLRSEEKAPGWKQDKRPPQERESWYWLEATRAATKRLRHAAPNCTPWFVYDRAGDYRLLLKCAVDEKVEMTVRVAQNRVIEHKGHRRKLLSTVRRQPVAGRMTVRVPRGPERRARVVTCEVRFVSQVRIKLTKKRWEIFSVVRVRETSYVPTKEERICWTLLTTHRVVDFDAALDIIRGYTYRWRVEEVHKTWKTGACKIEESQLRSYDALRRWATILAAVATRIERLKRLSREQPNLDALTEFSQNEIDAAIMLTETKKWAGGDSMNLREAVRLVAMVGGYMGRKGDGPPGSITLRRGLERIEPAARVMGAMASQKK